jgi:Concanavalin A-like lectin/glucanases superfamily
MRFDGVNDWVTVADGAANAPLDVTNRMTIEAWVNPTSLNGWETVVLKERAGDMNYALYAHDGSPDPSGFAVPAGYNRIGATNQAVRGTTQIPLNAWTHLAVTYDGTNQRMYVNGNLVSTRPQTGNTVVSNNALRIGGNAVWTTEFFGGLIDEVRIYRTVRSQTQIQSDMNTPITPVP